MWRTILACVLVALVAQSCGSGADSSGNGGGSGGSTGAAGGGGAAGALGGTSGCDKDLTGTWDLLATSFGGGPSSGIMILGVEGFTVVTSGGQLTYTATKSATWATSGSRRTIGVQNTPASLNSGNIPVVLGGHWVLTTTPFKVIFSKIAWN